MPPRPGLLPLEAQDSVTLSEDWGSEDEGDYQNYYGEEDMDVNMIASGNEGGGGGGGGIANLEGLGLGLPQHDIVYQAFGGVMFDQSHAPWPEGECQPD